MAGIHPKAVQTVMRHSTMTLTMGTNGHLFPGQEADTVALFPKILAGEPSTLLSTGTDDAMSPSDKSAARGTRTAAE